MQTQTHWLAVLECPVREPPCLESLVSGWRRRSRYPGDPTVQLGTFSMREAFQQLRLPIAEVLRRLCTPLPPTNRRVFPLLSSGHARTTGRD